MSTRVASVWGEAAAPAPEPTPAATRHRRDRIRALRSRRELRPGLALASALAACLAVARLIDVTADGKVMTLFAAAYAVGLALAALFRPRWFLPLVVVYLPFSKSYPLPVAGITGLNMMNLVLALGPIAWAASRRTRGPGMRVRATEVVVLLYAAVASLGVVTAVLSGHAPAETAQNYRTWVSPIVLFFLARGLVRDREDVAGLLRVLAWTVFLVAACTWTEGIDRSDRTSIDRARVPGLMEQSNTMGAFLVYYGVPLLALAVGERSWRIRAAYVAGYLVAARALLYTFSRGAYLSFAAGSTTVLLLGKPLLLPVLGAAGVAGMGFFPSLVPDSVAQRLGRVSLERTMDPMEDPNAAFDRSSSLRLVLWKGGLEMVAQRPFQGFGLARFVEVVGDYTEQPLREDDPVDAHNAYLLVAAELGLPALALMLLVLLTWGLSALDLFFRHRHPLDRRLGLVFLGSLAGVLVSCMVGSRFSDEALIGYFWMLAAMVVVVRRLREPARRPA